MINGNTFTIIASILALLLAVAAIILAFVRPGPTGHKGTQGPPELQVQRDRYQEVQDL